MRALTETITETVTDFAVDFVNGNPGCLQFCQLLIQSRGNCFISSGNGSYA